MTVGQEAKKPRERPKAKKDSRISKEVLILSLFVVAIVTLSANTIIAFNKWSGKNEIVTQNPIVLDVRTPIFTRPYPADTLSPWVEDGGSNMTEEEVLATMENPLILKVVRMLESTGGVNDGCEEDGLVNGFGYRQNSSEFRCYKDFRSVAKKVDDWFTERLDYNNNHLPEALCYYNKGIAGQMTCDYSQGFLGLLADQLKD